MPVDKKTAKKTETPLRAGLADQSLAPTSVSEWVKPSSKEIGSTSWDEGFIAELPSGNRVMMKRSMDMSLMMASGRIPNPLAGVVQKMIDTHSPRFPAEAEADSLLNQQLLDLVRETAVACVIEPPFAMPEARGKVKDASGQFIPEDAVTYQERITQWECPEGHISIFDVKIEDQMFIFAVAQGAAADLARFREQSQQLVGDVPDSQGVRKPTKRTNGAGSKSKKK